MRGARRNPNKRNSMFHYLELLLVFGLIALVWIVIAWLVEGDDTFINIIKDIKLIFGRKK